MNRREFFKGAAALAAVAPLATRQAFAHAAKPKAGNNPIWLMTSAFASDPDFEAVVKRAKSVGAQGLELCVFRRDTDRADHIATHLDYDNFTPERAKRVLEICNNENIRISVGAYDNLIGAKTEEMQLANQNHILKLIRMAAMLGGDANDVVCGTFVGYDHILGRTDGGFEKNLLKFKKVFQPILNYAKSLGVTVCVENCPMEGWLPVTAPDAYNNLPGCLAARKLMYAVLDDDSALQETYDPSHDIWQHIDPSDVIEAMDFKKLRRVHIKGTRNFTNDADAVGFTRSSPSMRTSRRRLACRFRATSGTVSATSRDSRASAAATPATGRSSSRRSWRRGSRIRSSSRTRAATARTPATWARRFRASRRPSSTRRLSCGRSDLMATNSIPRPSSR